MFAYERAFVGMGSFGGKNRLDFREAENRVFYLALHRQTAYASFLSVYFLVLTINILVILQDEDARERLSSSGS